MDRMVFTAMAAARQTQRLQALATNNLAHAGTDGFRADLRAAMTLEMNGPGFASRAVSGLMPGGVDLTPGPIMRTGNPLDVAIQGEGFFAVEAKDGTEAYTRAGAFTVDASGMLLTQDGRPVLGDGGPITLPPYEQVLIGDDGTISVRPKGAGGAQLAQVGRLRLVNPPEAQVVKRPDGLLGLADGSNAAPAAEVRVVSGSLEGSNVNAVGAMVRQIELARQFEAQVKLMNAAKTLDESGDRLVRQG
jgi:flagellar basal-body rod protein FlgF